MKIEPGKIIKYQQAIHSPFHGYWGTFIVEARFPDPVVMSKVISEKLSGMEIGEILKVEVPESAQLAHQPSLVLKVPKERFNAHQPLQTGMVFRAKFDNRYYSGYIKKLDNEIVYLDCNPPWNGQTLNITIMILDIRDATEEEAGKPFKSKVTISN